MSTRLTRSDRDRVIGGVCGGIAERTGYDSSVVRLVFVLSLLLPGPQLVIYLILWAVIPASPDAARYAQQRPISAPPSVPPADRRAMPTVSEVTSNPLDQSPQPWTSGNPTNPAEQHPHQQ